MRKDIKIYQDTTEFYNDRSYCIKNGKHIQNGDIKDEELTCIVLYDGGLSRGVLLNKNIDDLLFGKLYKSNIPKMYISYAMIEDIKRRLKTGLDLYY